MTEDHELDHDEAHPPHSPEPLDHPDEQATPEGRATTARSAVLTVLLAVVLCVLIVGDSISRSAEEMPEGVVRDVVTAVGKPAGSVAEALPFASAADSMVGWFEKDELKVVRAAAPAGGGPATAGSGGEITAADFDRRSVQVDGPAPVLKTVTVTGDSMAQPLDAHLARRLAPRGVQVARDPRLGSAISKDEPVDWPALAPEQIAEEPAEVVVMLLGANEGFPLPAPGGGDDAACCSADWAAAYAARVRGIAQAWLDGGAKQILWLALPAPRDERRVPIARAVNAAARVGVGGFGARAKVLPTDELFTPGFKYRDAMKTGSDGREVIVRAEDGIHLNEEGGEVAAQLVERELSAAWALGR